VSAWYGYRTQAYCRLKRVWLFDQCEQFARWLLNGLISYSQTIICPTFIKQIGNRFQYVFINFTGNQYGTVSRLVHLFKMGQQVIAL
jgi:hypothetical protein